MAQPSNPPRSFRRGITRLWRGRALESQHLFAVTVAVGVVCGLVAVAFHTTIRFAEAQMFSRVWDAPPALRGVLCVAVPAAGGLLAGILLTWFSPRARGSGIPQVKQAYAGGGGGISLRESAGKFAIAALQIGAGASLGREGPTVHICSGVTSALARWTRLSPRASRRLLPVGVAAGIAAAFNAPIAAVTFTIEEIVGGLDQSVLSGVVVAAAVAAVIERSLLGTHPMIEIPQDYSLEHVSSLGTYAVLGLCAAFVSTAFTEGLLRLRLWFRGREHIPAWVHPSIGAGLAGVLALIAWTALDAKGVGGSGYETLELALGGKLGVATMLGLCAFKLAATILSYSSGGAGGIFTPVLFIGAMLGGAVGSLDAAVLHHGDAHVGAFALVGMGALFAGVIRAPITSVLILFEMTGGYGLVLPLMVANTIAYGVARLLRPTPIYEALLEQDGVHLRDGAPRGSAAPIPDSTSPYELAVAARTVAGDAKADELEQIWRSNPTVPIVVQSEGAAASLVTAEQAEPALRDPILRRLLIASDLALDAPIVGATATLDDVAAAVATSDAEAAIVLSPPDGPLVIRRDAVANALLARAARRAGPPAVDSSRPPHTTPSE